MARALKTMTVPCGEEKAPFVRTVRIHERRGLFALTDGIYGGFAVTHVPTGRLMESFATYQRRQARQFLVACAAIGKRFPRVLRDTDAAAIIAARKTRPRFGAAMEMIAAVGAELKCVGDGRLTT